LAYILLLDPPFEGLLGRGEAPSGEFARSTALSTPTVTKVNVICPFATLSGALGVTTRCSTA
jgi:hypothetical protein